MTKLDQLPLTCQHWGTYRAEVVDGRIVALHDFEQDVDPSPIGRGAVGALRDRTRITAPAVRKSWYRNGPGAGTDRRGSEPFVEVSWDEAEELVAAELDRVRKTHGNEAIFGGSYGWASAGRLHHAPSQLKRFLNLIGGYTTRVNTYSLAAGEVILRRVMAPLYWLLDTSTTWGSIASSTELFVAFGGVPFRNSQINAGGVSCHSTRRGAEQAVKAGVEFVNVSPVRSDLDLGNESAVQWLPVGPGTDTALLLGIAHTLLEEGLHDESFLKKCTVGFSRFRAYLDGTEDGIPKSADWASEITQLSASDVRSLARRMAASRTMISVSWSLTRQDHGEQPFWAAIAVAAMLGEIGLPGGGIGFGYGAVNMVGDGSPAVAAATFPQGQNPTGRFIPVARISDMLLNPGGQFDYNGAEYEYPDIDLIYWAGGNPFHHHQDLNRLLRAWRKPSTIIVNEWCWNAMAKHSDIVLPCTTPFERADFAVSRSPYIVYMEKLVDAPKGCRNDFQIFAGLARRFGLLEEFTEGRSEAEWLAELYGQTVVKAARQGFELPPLDQLRQQRWFRIDTPAKDSVMLEDFRADPDANPLPTPSGRIEIHSDAIAGFSYEDCAGHPKWYEPEEWLGSADASRPLHLISSQPASKLHSQLDQGAPSRAAKIAGREPVQMNPADASARGIREGGFVRVHNDRGSCVAVATITSRVRPGVVAMSTGAWLDPEVPGEPGSMCKHGNPNVLTKDRGTSRLAQGPTAHSCLVEVSAFAGTPPPVTAFEPPEIEKV
ncbi:MAG: molybdopterin-dependent oxidoreductase [Rhodobacteraceae bacterium]|nr:molybdopterin-dependent oxidoreductase [Paracoccaceae bacterium]